MATYTISALARSVGLARSTLLYYDRIGLLSPSSRSSASYRLYDEEARERLEAIRTYRAVGLDSRRSGRCFDDCPVIFDGATTEHRRAWWGASSGYTRRPRGLRRPILSETRPKQPHLIQVPPFCPVLPPKTDKIEPTAAI
ncbi:MAG: MerR family transcriptional regulator [Myxococcales bacterium]|nr:MerR family transcriptional regulator [Myxococcales bacterium]